LTIREKGAPENMLAHPAPSPFFNQIPPLNDRSNSPYPNSQRILPPATRRRIPLIASPPVGAAFVAITVFLLIAFSSNRFTSFVSLRHLGMGIALAVTAFLALIVLILFVL